MIPTLQNLTVKALSLKQRVRTLADKTEGGWKTINGRHVLVGKGETPLEALKRGEGKDEISNTNFDHLSKIASSAEFYVEGWRPSEQVKKILRSPLVEKFQDTNAKIVYRAVYKGTTKSNRGRPIVAYSESKNAAYNALQDYEGTGEIVVYAKQVRKQDVVLNFSKLVSHLKSKGLARGISINEKEIWMKPNSYYTSFKNSERV